MATQNNKWLIAILIIALLFIISMFSAFIFGVFLLIAGTNVPDVAGNVAVIELEGPIVGSTTQSALFSAGVSSPEVVQLIEDANDDDSIEAVLFMINSPGGSAVASEEIANAINNLNKPSVAVIREVGASGAYWIASATDHIIASPISITGSIGVIGSYLDFSGFIQDHNVTYQRLVAGQYKDAGSPLRPLNAQEEQMLQALLDDIHDVFITTVAQNRNLTEAHVRELATGFVYLGKEAQTLGLIDELGDKNTAIKYLETTYDLDVDLVEFKPTESFFEQLAGVSTTSSYEIGQGIGDALVTENPQPPQFLR